MHKLDRERVPAPACLATHDWHRETWDAVSPAEKQEITAALKGMQGDLCAYCECSIDDPGGHIEHFRRKNAAHFPSLTFEWTNLFRSCNAARHCGRFKDRPGADSYDADALIKPDADDPDRFLYFHSTDRKSVV